jgi:hypothetical protein
VKFIKGRSPANYVDLTGRRFRRLIVMERVTTGMPAHKPHWRCVCDCGKEVIVAASNLRSGNSKSCGCLRPKFSLYSVMRKVICMRKNTARKRRIPWTVSEEEAMGEMRKPCFYCGKQPAHCMAGLEEFKYNGLDRIDSQDGYIPGNVRACCWDCNAAKSDMTPNQFAAWCIRMTGHAWWKKSLKDSDARSR